MKYFINIILIISLSSCGKNEKLTTHLKNLNKINSQIRVNEDWVVINTFDNNDEEYYCLREKRGDTVSVINFWYYKKNNIYILEDYIKSYFDQNNYVEMELKNSDTLYFFKAKMQEDKLNKNQRREIGINDMDFIIGKYYYLYKNIKLTVSQMEYFKQHRDSLMKIRGNKLPVLPGINISQDSTIEFPEERAEIER